MKQIALPLSLDRQFSFDNYFSDQAGLVVSSLRAVVLGQGEFQLGIWGAGDSGKTHLLNASADFARRQRIALQLYDARQLCDCEAFEMDDLEGCEVLAVDNLDAIAGNADWEAFFYQAINHCRAGDLRLIFAMNCQPEHLQAQLDDFRSRLQWGLLLQLKPQDDDGMREIIRRRAGLLGIDLSDDVLAYLMRHYARNLTAQMAILQQLDGASLSQQRRVTIPLVKKTLSQIEAD